MRIIAGEARGREVLLPKGRTTRPILALLMGRLFNILGARLEDEVVWDLFAGSGTLGLEALSRGAGHCLFVEKDRDSHAVLQLNVDRLGFRDRARTVRGDCAHVEFEAREARPSLVFLDPPFPLVRESPDILERLLQDVVAPRLQPDGRVVLRTPSDFVWPFEPGSLRQVDRRDHGENALIFMRR